MTKKVVIVDYGLSNLLSITRAFEHIGVETEVTDDPKKLATADRIVLPGVGAFPLGITELKKRGFFDEIKNVLAKKQTPIIGICLGMQMMLTKGFEIEETEGLNLVEGEIIKLPSINTDGSKNKVPHVAWSQIQMPAGRSWDKTILEYNQEHQYMYFVHSYYANTFNKVDVLAETKFGDITFTSAFQKDNIFGTQFHPEKSGENGLRILKAFIELS
jgi:glutamine amidotransferase